MAISATTTGVAVEKEDFGDSKRKAMATIVERSGDHFCGVATTVEKEWRPPLSRSGDHR